MPSRLRQHLYRIFMISLLAATLAACERPEQVEAPATAPEPAAPAPTPEPEPAPAPHVVEVTALDFAFDAPAEIPAGWTTFRFTNAGEQEHFMVLWPLPGDKTFEDFMAEVLEPFMEIGDEYAAGRIDREELMAGLGEALPEWVYPGFQGAGGPGLTSPGRVAQTTVRLEPGTYVMECYVKAPDGRIHNMMGMIRPLVVTAESSGAPEPSATMELLVFNDRIEVQGDPTAGRHTIRVRIVDTPEGLLGHDIHLARLGEFTPAGEIVTWMDWVDEMKAPAPAVFLGGVEQMPAGSTAYLTVDLEPGRYLWVSEEYAQQGVVMEFSVE